ncbi:hypothetical protein BT96DRAFT_914657 [Gymnopus androsaceus JB14]|uniref:Uncharacterized protein n=1 Tax=Gymnopus androsaceus JB14 TaxID=1447944 RepID=A0A6A4IET9_9AGAR|nr:hypothetical protein BT96DRAFT_914657 [Gymnopus androsaceus JB14]
MRPRHYLTNNTRLSRQPSQVHMAFEYLPVASSLTFTLLTVIPLDSNFPAEIGCND